MNVLVLLNYFDRDGGTSKTLTEGKYLAALGVHLVIVVPRNPFAKADVSAKLQALGLKHYSAPTHYRMPFILFPFALLRISRIIRREKIDLLHANHGKALVLGAILSRLFRLPLVYTIHGVSRRELPTALGTLWFRHVSRVIAVSEESAAYFARRVRFPSDRVAISRNGIDFSHFRVAARPQDPHFNLLYISRLDRDKRRAVETAMDAAARMFPDWPQIRLHILGGGRQIGKVKKKARALNLGIGREIISIGGWTDDPAEHYVRADLILGVGRCVLEAIAAGRPAVVVGNDMIGGLVSAANFSRLQKTNFSGRGSGVATSCENLVREFRRMADETPGRESLRALASRDHDAAKLASEVRAIYQGLVPGKSN